MKKQTKDLEEISSEQLVFMSDEMYTPIHYKGMVVEQPFYSGDGNHSVAELEKICNQYKEYCHQQAVIKERCMKAVMNLKFNIPYEQLNEIQNQTNDNSCAETACVDEPQLKYEDGQTVMVGDLVECTYDSTLWWLWQLGSQLIIDKIKGEFLYNTMGENIHVDKVKLIKRKQ